VRAQHVDVVIAAHIAVRARDDGGDDREAGRRALGNGEVVDVPDDAEKARAAAEAAEAAAERATTKATTARRQADALAEVTTAP
jgi:hypothetical protein